MKELVCIVCPRGCELNISEDLVVTGNKCPRGEMYAKKELTNPTRTVTSTIKIVGASISNIPVKTDREIDKDKIFELLKFIKNKEVQAPIRLGDILIKKPIGIDVNIVATRSVDKIS